MPIWSARNNDFMGIIKVVYETGTYLFQKIGLKGVFVILFLIVF